MWQTLLEHPWWLLSLFYPVIYIWRINLNEKRKWGHRLHPPIPYLCKTFLLGAFVGIVLSLFISIYPMYIPFTVTEIWIIWIATVFLSLFGWRFACISYAVALCGLLHLVSSYVSYSPEAQSWFKPWWDTIVYFSLFDWLWLVALLHLCEAFLVRVDGNTAKQIIEHIDEQKQRINGFQHMRVWSIPLLLPTSMGWFPFPMMISFAETNFSRSMSQQRRRSGTLIFIYACILIFLLVLCSFYHSLLIGAWLCSWLGHEGLFQWNRLSESKSSPMYISTNKGLNILEVLPHSPAAEMGIKTGDILHRVNGTEIQTVDDIKKITSRSAYCKLEVLDEHLDQHLLHRVMYEDDPQHLGIIGALSVAEASATTEEKE